MNIAVIPARGGSKRVPRKNIKFFMGKPMIAWSIEAAQASGLFNHIIVSTDDLEIAEVALRYGAEVPFMRPESLSDDFAGTSPVVAHAVQWALEQGLEVKGACCIYATAPFIQLADLKLGLELFNSGNWDYVFSATDYATPIFRAFKQMPAGGLEMFFPENINMRSQDFPTALHDAAQFYWGKPLAWLENRRIFDANSSSVLIPRWRVQDIDTLEDWHHAEMLAPLIINNSERVNVK